ncbi:MAG: hypothetical protein ACTSWY_04500 [Promethearchaeota archaeon]
MKELFPDLIGYIPKNNIIHSSKKSILIDDKEYTPLYIEFEYESSNFEKHGHDINGCDAIICWIDDKKNWKKDYEKDKIIALNDIIIDSIKSL